MAIINGYQSLNPNREAGRFTFQKLPSVIHALGIPATLEHHASNSTVRLGKNVKGVSPAAASATSGASGGGSSGGSSGGASGGGIGIHTKLSTF